MFFKKKKKKIVGEEGIIVKENSLSSKIDFGVSLIVSSVAS